MFQYKMTMSANFSSMQMFLRQKDPVQSWPVQIGQCKVETNRIFINMYLFPFQVRVTKYLSIHFRRKKAKNFERLRKIYEFCNAKNYKASKVSKSLKGSKSSKGLKSSKASKAPKASKTRKANSKKKFENLNLSLKV